MKKKIYIYIALTAFHSLMFISIFAGDVKVCITHDYVGLKSLESSCCETSVNSNSYIENKDDCLFFKLSTSHNGGQHLTKQTKTKKYCAQKTKVLFFENSFADFKKNHIYRQHTSGNNNAGLIKSGSCFLLALHTVLLL